MESKERGGLELRSVREGCAREGNRQLNSDELQDPQEREQHCQ